MTKLISPAPNGIPGLEFGSTKAPYNLFRRHKGKDWKWLLANPEGSRPTVAPISGTVVAAFNDGKYHEGWGNYVDIQVTRSLFVRLAHHATGTVRVSVGDVVEAGDRIGTMGDTGDTRGIHLHEELWIDDVRVDPDLYRGENGKHLPGTPVPAGELVDYKHTKVVLAPLNLRKSPKTGAVVATIPAGTLIKTGRTSGGWTPVKYGSKTGWVAAEFTLLRTKTVIRGNLTLRDRPAPLVKAKTVARLKKGAKVTVLAVDGKTSKAKYWKVQAGRKTGWVIAEYVK